MAKIETGCKLQDYKFDTVYEKDARLSDKVKQADRTLLLFLRYYGCRMCQLEMREYTALYEQIRAKNAQLLVVLQSPVSTMLAQTKPGDVPYDIICDPDQALFREFELLVAASKEEMNPPEEADKQAARAAKIAEYGLVHGAYEGEELQLPGYFILDSEMNVLDAFRATTLGSLPAPAELIAKL